MITKHKLFRRIKRNEWKRIKGKIPTGKGYKKLRKYESRKNKKNPNKNNLEIKLPENIDFEENIENMVLITSDIEKNSKTWSPRFSLNHKNIKSISIAGLLYLVGQISKVAKAKNLKLKYNEELGLRKNDERIRYLFSKIGYWESFGITKPYTITQEMKDNYFLSIQTDTKSDILLLNKIKQFIKINIDFMNEYAIEYKFDDAVKEAMANSIEHAYPDDFKEFGKEKGKWWICGHFDKINNSLELVFYDYGMGIRKSITRNLGEEANRVLIDRLKDNILRSDADLIEIAINGNLTKYNNYKEHDRGKGFQRFQEFAKVSGHNCEMTIVSGKGKYKFIYDGKNQKEEIKKSTITSNIEGMLIKWKIQLNNKGEYDEKI